MTDQPKDSEGRKDDAAKLRIDLVPPEMILGTAAVLTYGAEKYGVRNWESGMGWGRVFGALMRHMWAWWGGANVDPETGLSHLSHAACCIGFLMAYEARRSGVDDRSVFGAQKADDPRPAQVVHVRITNPITGD